MSSFDLTTPDMQINIQTHKMAENRTPGHKRSYVETDFLVHYLCRETRGDTVFIHRLIPTIGECVDGLASIVECRQTGALGLSGAPPL